MAVLLGEKDRFSKVGESKDEYQAPIEGDSLGILDPCSNSEPSVDKQFQSIPNCCCSSPQVVWFIFQILFLLDICFFSSSDFFALVFLHFWLKFPSLVIVKLNLLNMLVDF